MTLTLTLLDSHDRVKSLCMNIQQVGTLFYLAVNFLPATNDLQNIEEGTIDGDGEEDTPWTAMQSMNRCHII